MPSFPLESEVAEVPDRRPCEPKVITDLDELQSVVDFYLTVPEFVFDVETIAPEPYTGLHTAVNRVTWLALATAGRVDVIPVDHPHGNVRIPKCRVPVVTWDHENLTYKGQPRKVTRYAVREPLMWPRRQMIPPGLIWKALRPLFWSDARKIGHNVKFDLKTVANPNHFGELPPGPYGDTLVLAHMLQVDLAFGLDRLTQKFFEHKYEQLGKYVATAEFSDVASYVAQDVRYTWLLWRLLQPGRRQYEDLYDIEMQLFEVLTDVERFGVPIDLTVIDNIGATLTVEQAEVRKQIYRMRGLHEVWNVDSNDELARWFFAPKKEGGVGIRPKAEFITKTGKNSVSARALASYSDRPEVATVLRHRELTKTRGTYVDGMKSWVVNGLIHPDHKIHGTVTGRLSCSSPNLQNIPKVDSDNDNTLALAIRSAFVAPAGHRLLVADYDQIELRVAAAYSQDKTMVRTFLEGLDPHAMAAATIYGIPLDQVTKVQRGHGKTFNFALLYGAGSRRIAAAIGCSVKHADELLDEFWRGYKGFDRWKDDVVRRARRERAVWTWLGRKRPLPQITWADHQQRSRAERQAVNTIIQGTAGEIMKLAMIRLHNTLDPEQARIVLTVHDELAVLCRSEPEALALTEKTMTEAMVGGSLARFKPYAQEEDDVAIPLTAEVHVGSTWAETKL